MDFLEFRQATEQIFTANPQLPTPNAEQTEKRWTLCRSLIETNKIMNLTAITEEKAVILRHFADSLGVSAYIPYGARIADIGCGAGFPTLPLAIFRPDLQILAVDSTAKRISYVSDTARSLGLENVMALAQRAEVLGNDAAYRESFDVVTARAVAALPVLAELCLPLVKAGGSFVAMKSQKASQEIEEASSAIAKCGGKLEKAEETALLSPYFPAEVRTYVLINKCAHTPKEFPRHFSKISKKPL